MTDEEGWTPLHFASHFGFPECVRVLLAHPKTNVNCRSRKGWRPLDTAGTSYFNTAPHQ